MIVTCLSRVGTYLSPGLELTDDIQQLSHHSAREGVLAARVVQRDRGHSRSFVLLEQDPARAHLAQVVTRLLQLAVKVFGHACRSVAGQSGQGADEHFVHCDSNCLRKVYDCVNDWNSNCVRRIISSNNRQSFFQYVLVFESRAGLMLSCTCGSARACNCVVCVLHNDAFKLHNLIFMYDKF